MADSATRTNRRRRLLWVGVIVVTAGLVTAVGVQVWDHYRTEYGDEVAVPWSRFEVSNDGRTLAFVGSFGRDCFEPHRVELEGTDPVDATVYYRAVHRRGGRGVYCQLDLDLPPVSVSLDAPLAEGTLVRDTSAPVFGACSRSQRVGGPAFEGC